MENLTPIEWQVLDATADDPESLEQIYRSVRGHAGPPVLLADVADAVQSLLDGGLLVAGDESGRPGPETGGSSPLWKGCFSPSDRGREAWAAAAAARRAGPSGRRSLFGVWSDLGINLTPDDVSEARREMWATFPRDIPQ